MARTSATVDSEIHCREDSGYPMLAYGRLYFPPGYTGMTWRASAEKARDSKNAHIQTREEKNERRGGRKKS